MAWKGPDRIPVAPIREALEHALATTDLTLSDVCRELGWKRNPGATVSRGTMDISRLKRCTGIESTKSRYRKTGHVTITYVTTITINKAQAIAMAIGVDFDRLYDGMLPEVAPAAHCKECDEPMIKRHRSGLCGFCLEGIAVGNEMVAA